MKTYDPEKNATDVRQASPRKMNMRVLVISLVGVIVALGVVLLIYSLAQPAPPV